MSSISIIAPVYNGIKYLEGFLESVLSQTFEDFELILVEDGSEDGSAYLCDEYAKKDSRIKVIHKEHKGVSAARNRGIEIAQGEYIMFADCDDRIHPDICRVFYDAAEREKADICMGCAIEGEVYETQIFKQIGNNSYECISEKEDRLKRIYNSDKHKYWVVWCKLYRKELFDKVHFEEGKKYEDNALVFRLLYAANKILDFDETFYFYQINRNGITKSDCSVGHLDLLWAYEEQIKFYKEINDEWMLRTMAVRYLRACSDFYYKFKPMRKMPEVEEKLKQKIHDGFKEYGEQFELSVNELPNVFKILFPVKYFFYVAGEKIKRIFL